MSQVTGGKEINSSSTDVKLKKDVQIVVQRIEESTDPEVLAYFTRLKEMPDPDDSSDDSDSPEVEDEKPGESAAPSTPGNPALCSVPVAASPAVIPSAASIKEEPLFFPTSTAQNIKDPMENTAFEPKTECSTSCVPQADIDAFDETIIEDLLEESASACPVPVVASPPVDPSAITIKKEPTLSPLAGVQNAEDPLEDSAFEPKIEYSDIDVFEEPIKHLLEESTLSPVSTKDEPPFSSSSSMQNAEDPLEDSAFEPKTEYSDIVVFEEPIKHLLEESTLSPVSTKDEPPFSSSSSMQNAEDPLEDSAFEPKTEYSDIDVFEEPIKHLLEESASSPLSTKDEPPFSSSSSMQNAEDPLEDSAFEPKTEYSDIDGFEEPIKHLLEKSALSPVSTKDEPPFPSSSSMQNAEDPLEDSAFEPKIEYSDIDVFEEPIKHLLEESALSPVSTKDEPPFSSSSSMQNAEDPLEDSAFEPKTEFSDIDVFEEPIKHLLEESASSPLSTKDEPPFSSSSSMQNAEDPLEDSAFEPKTEYSDIDGFEEPIKHLLEESASTCPVPVSAWSIVDSSAIIIKEEPTLSPLAGVQNAEDSMEDSAYEPVDWCSGDADLPKTESCKTPPPCGDIDAFNKSAEDHAEEGESACPVAASPTDEASDITIKDEPLFFPSSAEDPMENTSFEPKTERSPTPSPSADFDASSKSAFEEPTEDPLEGLAPSQTESLSLPTMAEYIISPDVKRRIQFTRAVPREAITAKTGRDRNDCAVDQFSSALSEAVTKIPLGGDSGAELRRKVEALRTKGLKYFGDVSFREWLKFVASLPPPRSPTPWRVQASTSRDKYLFHIQETARYENYRHAFTYRLHGYESVVGPARTTRLVTRVYDAVARLPNGVGSLGDILLLLSDSQFEKISPPWSAFLVSKVVGALAMLNLEDITCLCYNAKHKMCVYLLRGMSEKEIESLYSQQQNASEASKSMGPSNVKHVVELRRAESLLKPGGPSASLPPGHAQPTLPSHGKRMHPSTSGPKPVCIDTNGAEQRHIPKKLAMAANCDGSTVAVTAAFGEKSSATASANAVLSSSSVKALTSSVPVASSTVSSPVTTLGSLVLLSSPASTSGNEMLSLASSSLPLPMRLANGDLSVPCLPGAQSLPKLGGPPAHSPLRHAQPTLPSPGKRMHSSNSGPKPVCIDPNNTEQRHCLGKLRVVIKGDGSVVVIPATFGKQSSVTASGNGIPSSASSSSSRSVLESRISSLPSTSVSLTNGGQSSASISSPSLFSTTWPNRAHVSSPSPTTFINAVKDLPSPPLSTLQDTALPSGVLSLTSSSSSTTTATTTVLTNGVLSSSASPSATLPGAEPLRNKTAAVTDKNCASALHSQAASAFSADEFFSTSVEDPVQSAGVPSDEELKEVVPDFLTKLWAVVEDVNTDNMIRWSSYGLSFLIINEGQFAEHFLLLYYEHQDMLKFLKELEKYGFEKLDSLEFFHKFFVKKKPHLLYYIERNTEDRGLAVGVPSRDKLLKSLPSFLTKLWNMVDKLTDDSIHWSSDGSSFVIRDRRRFCDEFLPYQTYYSVLMGLYSYGFQKIKKDQGGKDCKKLEFLHKWFVRNRPHLLFYLKKTGKKRGMHAHVKREAVLFVPVHLRGKPLPFVSNLWNMVEDPGNDDVVCWASDGASFLIRDTTRFAAEILPLYYKDLDMYNFLVELYSYKFKRLEKITEEFIPCERQYTHYLFEKDKPELLPEIRK